jgi:hypothetical protein
MEVAADLLVRTTLPVAQIARRVGYSDASRFGQHFKRTHRTTPAPGAAVMQASEPSIAADSLTRAVSDPEGPRSAAHSALAGRAVAGTVDRSAVAPAPAGRGCASGEAAMKCVRRGWAVHRAVAMSLAAWGAGAQEPGRIEETFRAPPFEPGR